MMMRHLLSCLFVCWMGVCCSSLEHASASETLAFKASRPFKGQVHRQMAEEAARTAADLAAFDYAAKVLARQDALRFLTHPGDYGRGIAVDPVAIARMLCRVKHEKIVIQGFPPNLQAVATVQLPLRSASLDEILRALNDTEYLALFGSIYKLQRQALAEYDRKAQEALEGGALADSSEPTLEQALERNQVLNAFAELLLSEYESGWKNPQEALKKIEALLARDPKNPLVLVASAEIYILLDRPTEAKDRAEQALAVMPSFARAHDVIGTSLLRKSLPALAADAFGSAIAHAPDYAPYRVHRAAAYLVQEEQDLVCKDLHQACVLGDCSGLAWARNQGKCFAKPIAVNTGKDKKTAVPSAVATHKEGAE